MTSKLTAHAKAVFLTWEWRRPLYNGILILSIGLLFMRIGVAESVADTELMFYIARCLVLANLCFLAGPCVELYAHIIGWTPAHLGRYLFILGAVLSVPVFPFLILLFNMARVH